MFWSVQDDAQVFDFDKYLKTTTEQMKMETLESQGPPG